jgi:GNAT superfamily N-acetyltransferase
MTTTYYLEQTSPSSLRAKTDARGLEVRECEIRQYQLNRFLYQFVGGPWKWTDRLTWTDERWVDYAESDNLRTWAESDNLRTWLACLSGSPAGYYELQRQDRGNVEIVLFGLAARFLDHGLGGYFLSHALESAWAWEGTKRVWVHTCNHDHPHALKNYTARGMNLYHTETTG